MIKKYASVADVPVMCSRNASMCSYPSMSASCSIPLNPYQYNSITLLHI